MMILSVHYYLFAVPHGAHAAIIMTLDGPTSCQNDMWTLLWVANSELLRVTPGCVTAAVSEGIADYELCASIIKPTASDRQRYKLV